MLHKLIFDTSSVDTIADSHSVGAYLRAGSDGALIDHQTIATKEWLNVASALFDGAGTAITSTAGALDVNLKSPISVNTDLNGIYDVSTNATPDNVGLIVNSRGASPDATTQLQRLTAGAASSDAVVAANIHGLDVNAFGMVYNGTTWDRLKGTGGAVNIADGGNSITVDAVALDIRHLAFATDKVDASGSSVSISGDVNVTQGTSPWVISGSVTASDAALANTAIATAKRSLTLADTEEAAIASPLANRKYVWLMNNDNRTAYIGPSGVDATTGFPIPAGSMIDMRAGAAVAIHWVSGKTSHDLRSMELS